MTKEEEETKDNQNKRNKVKHFQFKNKINKLKKHNLNKKKKKLQKDKVVEEDQDKVNNDLVYSILFKI